MDRIVLGRLLILHIKCFYIGSVIPFRSGMPRRLFCFPCGGRVDRLLCRGPRSCRRRAWWRRRNSSWRRWWTRTTSNEEGQKHACFFLHWLCLVYVVVCQHRSACEYFQHILFPSQGIISLFLTMAMLRFPNKPCYLVPCLQVALPARGAVIAKAGALHPALNRSFRCSWWFLSVNHQFFRLPVSWILQAFPPNFKPLVPGKGKRKSKGQGESKG